MTRILTRILVFGVFDGVHEGHRNFLKQARECGDFLIAAVTMDEAAEVLKGRRPRQELGVRLQALRESGLVDEAAEGDREAGSWEVIKKYKPDIIALGYDQTALQEALEAFLKREGLEIEIRVMEAYRPDEFHSSILNSKFKNQNAK